MSPLVRVENWGGNVQEQIQPWTMYNGMEQCFVVVVALFFASVLWVVATFWQENISWFVIHLELSEFLQGQLFCFLCSIQTIIIFLNLGGWGGFLLGGGFLVLGGSSSCVAYYCLWSCKCMCVSVYFIRHCCFCTDMEIVKGFEPIFGNGTSEVLHCYWYCAFTVAVLCQLQE